MRRAIRVLAAVCLTVAVVAPAGAGAATRVLYASGPMSNSVGGYAIAANGSLTDIAGPPASPFSTGAATRPVGLALTPNGRNVFTGDTMSGQVSHFLVSATTGALTALPNTTAGAGADGVAVTPDGKFVYTANFNVASVSGFSNTSGTLAATPSSPYTSDGFPAGVAITPDGTHLYTSNFADTISAFNIGPDGALTPIAGSPFADGGTDPFGIAITPDGSHLYTGHAGSANVSGFNIGATGALTPITGSPFPVGTTPQSVSASPHAPFLYAADAAANNIDILSIAGDGKLTAVGAPVAAGTGPRGGAFTPDGSRFYVNNLTTNNISGYSVGVDGTLSQVSGSPHPSGLMQAGTLGLAVTPDQGPLAAFKVTAGGSGHPTTFNGGISTDPDGTVFRYDWDFGDGATLADGGPTPSHTYVKPGDYTAALTVTDSEGCSNKLLYTGQTVSCNGSGLASVSQTVHVPDATPPTLTLSGKKSQKLGKSVLVKAACNEACSATATGKLIVKAGKGHAKAKTRKFKLKKATAQITAGAKKALKLKISKKGRKAATAALASKGKVSAKLTVKAADAAGNAATKKRTVKIKAGKH